VDWTVEPVLWLCAVLSCWRFSEMDVTGKVDIHHGDVCYTLVGMLALLDEVAWLDLSCFFANPPNRPADVRDQKDNLSSPPQAVVVLKPPAGAKCALTEESQKYYLSCPFRAVPRMPRTSR
jgi:hypothetical protein